MMHSMAAGQSRERGGGRESPVVTEWMCTMETASWSLEPSSGHQQAGYRQRQQWVDMKVLQEKWYLRNSFRTDRQTDRQTMS